MRLPLDGVVVLLSLGALFALGVGGGRPLFENLVSSRLTYVSVLALPLFVAFGVVRRRGDRAATVLRDWWPVLGVLLVYENLKHQHANRITEWLGIAPKDHVMLRADELLFGKCLALVFDGPFFAGAASHVLWFFYVWVYYLGPVVLLGWAYFVLEDDKLFGLLRRSLVLGLLGGYVLYLLVPVAGPLFVIGDRFTVPILTQPTLQKLTFSTLRFNWDCFPSLHTAIPWLLTFTAWSRLPRPGRALAALGAAGVTLSSVALRFHYGVDLLAGLAWAGLVFAAFRVLPGLAERTVPLPRALASTSLPRDPSAFRPRLLGTLFVITGCVGLLAEQAFEKLLGTLLGASTPAASVVLAVYFLGLTVGGAAYGPLLRPRFRNPLRLYAALEAGVALWALVLYLGYGRLIPLLAPFLSLGRDSFLALQGLRLVVAALWILPPTILMGATFPAIVDALDRASVPEPRRAMSRFYALNLLGAIGGALLGPYVAFPRWGVDGTLLFAYVMDGVVALTAFRLAAQAAATGPGPGAEIGVPAPANADPAGIRVLLAVGFASGFLFFGLEVVWTHLIGAVLGNSVYAFAAMLALVLSGLGLGGVAATRLFREERPVPVWSVSVILLAGTLLLAGQQIQWPAVPHRLAVWGAGLETFAQGELLRWIQAAVLLLPPAAVLGMVYPTLFRLDVFPAARRAGLTGQLGAFNSAGCILGALVTGFVLIPSFGSEATLLVLGLCAAASALALGLAYLAGARRIALLLAAASVVLALSSLPPWDRLSLTSGEHVYFRRNQVWPQTQLHFFHEDMHGGITSVVWNPAGVRQAPRAYLTLLTNGKFQGNDAWESIAQVGCALVPALHVEHRDAAMVIGLGTGHSAAVVEELGFRSVDVAEIAPGIVEAARHSFRDLNGGVLEKPNVRVHLEDGRNHLLLHPETYDLISMEVSSVWFAGSTNLYSREFYELARSRLRRGGVLQQWIQVHHIGINEVGSALATLRAVFPHVSFWCVGRQGILVASVEPQLLRGNALLGFPAHARRLGLPEAGAEVFLKETLLSRLLSPEDTSRLVQSIPLPLNTDANRFLEYATPRFNLSQLDHARYNVLLLSKFASFTPHRSSGLPESPFAEWLRSTRSEDFRRQLGLSSSEPGAAEPAAPGQPRQE